jgi:hypothetical protein
MAMMAASAFFFYPSQFDKSGVLQFSFRFNYLIAAVHYFYMRLWASFGESQHSFVTLTGTNSAINVFRVLPNTKVAGQTIVTIK